MPRRRGQVLELLAQVLRLSKRDRAYVARQLHASLEARVEKNEWEDAWAAEVRRRTVNPAEQPEEPVPWSVAYEQLLKKSTARIRSAAKSTRKRAQKRTS